MVKTATTSSINGNNLTSIISGVQSIPRNNSFTIQLPHSGVFTNVCPPSPVMMITTTASGSPHGGITVPSIIPPASTQYRPPAVLSPTLEPTHNTSDNTIIGHLHDACLIVLYMTENITNRFLFGLLNVCEHLILCITLPNAPSAIALAALVNLVSGGSAMEENISHCLKADILIVLDNILHGPAELEILHPGDETNPGQPSEDVLLHAGRLYAILTNPGGSNRDTNPFTDVPLNGQRGGEYSEESMNKNTNNSNIRTNSGSPLGWETNEYWAEGLSGQTAGAYGDDSSGAVVNSLSSRRGSGSQVKTYGESQVKTYGEDKHVGRSSMLLMEYDELENENGVFEV